MFNKIRGAVLVFQQKLLEIGLSLNLVRKQVFIFFSGGRQYFASFLGNFM